MSDIATIAALGIPTTGILALLGYMGWQIRGKQDKGTCAAVSSDIKKDLNKGSEKVDVSMCKTLHTNLTEDIGEIKVDLKAGIEGRIAQGLILERIETILERIDSNGNRGK